MDKTTKMAIGYSNRSRYMDDIREVKCVDGRTYMTDKTTARESNAFKRGGDIATDRPSANIVYKIDFFLSHGYRTNKAPKQQEREAIIEEYGLEYSDTLHRWFSTEERLFEKFQEKYPDELQKRHITSYGELAYRATYQKYT